MKEENACGQVCSITVQGQRVSYRTAGTGPSLVFLHGNPTHSGLWRNIISQLQYNYHCIATDLIGYGQSETPERPYAFSDHYETVARFLDRLTTESIYLVGHDWGGILALLYTLDHIQKIKGVILMETFPFPLQWSDFSWIYRYPWQLTRLWGLEKLFIQRLNMLSAMIPFVTCKLKGWQLWSHYPLRVSRAQRSTIYRLYQDLPLPDGPPALQQTFQVIEQNVTALTTPILLLNTKPGFLLRQHRVQQLRSRLRNLTIVELGGGLHFTPEEHPVKIAKSIDQWMTSQ